MLAFKLAFKNLFGAGLRTWLNVTVLSIAFVIIIFYNGFLEGWNIQAHTDTKAWETGSGQFWHPLYDPFDPYTFADAHAPVPEQLKKDIEENLITPVLITQATAYPNGRLLNILLKGIDPAQKILELPSGALASALASRQQGEDDPDFIPAIIGRRMALSAKLSQGDHLLVRWRDANGTFDAREITIVGIYKTNVPTVDVGQIWIPLDKLQQLTLLFNEATYFVVGKVFVDKASPEKAFTENESKTGWIYKNEAILLKEIDDIIAVKKGGSTVISGLLLAIALLAIFDTQVLSIFRRQKEIGTYIALGMTRFRVVRIFTIEGSAHSLLAIAFSSLWGIPLLLWLQRTGIPMPASADQAGLAIAEKIVPFYSAGMIISSVLLVVISSTIVSYLPTRRISKMKPTDALRGKMI